VADASPSDVGQSSRGLEVAQREHRAEGMTAHEGQWLATGACCSTRRQPRSSPSFFGAGFKSFLSPRVGRMKRRVGIDAAPPSPHGE
jgi:hypothetical protein